MSIHCPNNNNMFQGSIIPEKYRMLKDKNEEQSYLMNDILIRLLREKGNRGKRGATFVRPETRMHAVSLRKDRYFVTRVGGRERRTARRGCENWRIICTRWYLWGERVDRISVSETLLAEEGHERREWSRSAFSCSLTNRSPVLRTSHRSHLPAPWRDKREGRRGQRRRRHH